MKVYAKYLILAALCGFLNCAMMMKQTSPSVIDLICRFSFSTFIIDKSYIMELFRWYFPLLLFQVVWGTYLYRHFCSASVYYFSRCANRVRWFLKEAVKLYGFTVLYLLVMLATGVLLVGLSGNLLIENDSVIFFLYYLILHSLWLFSMTLLLNVLSIKLSSSGGFIVVGGFQLLSMALFILEEDLLDFNTRTFIVEKTRLLQTNPLSHLVLVWHSSTVEAWNEPINRFDITFDLNWSVFLLLLLTLVMLSVSCFIIRKQEFITINRETGGSI